MYVCMSHVSKPVVLNLWAATPSGAHVQIVSMSNIYIMIHHSSEIIVMK